VRLVVEVVVGVGVEACPMSVARIDRIVVEVLMAG